MAQVVTLTMASRGCSISGSGTVSQRMSLAPCQTSALIEVSPTLAFVWVAFSNRTGGRSVPVPAGPLP